MIGIYIGLDVHKRTVYVTEMEDDGDVKERYEIVNCDESWQDLIHRYHAGEVEIALETCTSGKYAARLLRDNGFSVHLADPSKLALIFNSVKKNDREDSYKLAKLLRLQELPEVHIPSRESDDLKTLVRYRKSLGEESTAIKNRIHAILAMHGIAIDESDTFGKRGMRKIENATSKLTAAENIVMSDMLGKVIELNRRKQMVEDGIARISNNSEEVKLLMTIPGINVYSAAAIMSEIDDIHRFSSKEKLASYAGLVPRQSQSGSRDQKGHILKNGPSMLRIILVNAAHMVIKYSKRMKIRYLKLVKRLGKSRAIVAIARALAETIWTMLSRRIAFYDEIDLLTEKKIESIRIRSLRPNVSKNVMDTIKLIKNQDIALMLDKLFS